MPEFMARLRFFIVAPSSNAVATRYLKLHLFLTPRHNGREALPGVAVRVV
jgi:hypothetical protein